MTESPAASVSGNAIAVTCPSLGQFGFSRFVLIHDDTSVRTVVLCTTGGPSRATVLPLGSTPAIPSFLSEERLAYVGTTGGGPSSTPDAFTSDLDQLTLPDNHTETAINAHGFVGAYGWTPDRSTVAYLVDSGGQHQLWLKRPTDDPQPLTPPIQVFGRGGREGEEYMVGFSADGHYVVLVDTAVYRLQVFRVSDGMVLYTAPSGGTGGLRTMALWEHQADRLYFRNDAGVFTWDPSGTVTSYAPGLHWENPFLSPDDRFLAYTVLTANGPQAEIRDLVSKAIASGPPLRTTVGLVGTKVLVENVEEPCPPNQMCGPVPFNETGKIMVFDLNSHQETAVALPTGWTLGAFWPRG